MTTPQAFDESAVKSGLVRQEVSGLVFRHAVYHRAAGDSGVDGPVHVYLSGDGTPYVRPGLIAADPTPRHPVLLKLMALDPASVLLLGRPCYHGYVDSPPCAPRLWTHARYGEEVVASMARALARVVPVGRKLILIGFSGGGALAVLLAGRVPGVVAVVTLAGNLDIDAWADLHSYARLRASFNPVASLPLAEGLVQLHYAGANDTQVPPALLQKALASTDEKLVLLADVRHDRGWDQHWPAILAELDTRLNRLSHGQGRTGGGVTGRPALRVRMPD